MPRTTLANLPWISLDLQQHHRVLGGGLRRQRCRHLEQLDDLFAFPSNERDRALNPSDGIVHPFVGERWPLRAELQAYAKNPRASCFHARHALERQEIIADFKVDKD